MKSHWTNVLLATAAIAPAIAIGAALLGTRWLSQTDQMRSLSLASAALVLASVSASLAMARSARSQQAAAKYLELLSRADISAVRTADPTQIVDDLPASSPWFGIFERLKTRLLDLHDRLEQTEVNQAAIDVRAQRNTQEHDRIAAILNSLNDAVLAVDEYDEIILANPRARDLFGFDVERDEKRMLADLVQCESLLELLTETRRRKSATQRSCEIALPGADAKECWFRVTARSIETRHGEGDNTGDVPHGAVAVLRDVSAQKEMQKRHAEFVSSVSHEMKTPLAAIKAYVELLADGEAENEETRDEFLTIIDSQADRLRRLVDNLLNIARIEAGVVKVSKTEQSLNEILEQVFSLMLPAAEDRQIELVKDLSPLYLGVFVDRDMMLQAAINLTSNAIKYTPHGRKVFLRSRMVDNAVEFEVEDEGVGLSPDDQQKVFEKFYRVKKDKNMAAGTGLGLPLANHIVKDVHQGRLTLKSQLGVGSTFHVNLPAAKQINRPEKSSPSPETVASL